MSCFHYVFSVPKFSSSGLININDYVSARMLPGKCVLKLWPNFHSLCIWVISPGGQILSQLSKLQVLVVPCTRARVNLKTWDKAAQMRLHSSMYNVLWNKWSSWCVSESVRLKYLGKSCVVIWELSCLLFQGSLASLQFAGGLLSLMVLGGASVSVLKWLQALLFSPKPMDHEMCIIFWICSAICVVHI